MIHKIFDSNNHVLWLVFSGLIMIIGLVAGFFFPIFVMLFRQPPALEIGYNPAEQMFWYATGIFIAIGIGLYLIYKLSGLAKRLVGAGIGLALSVLCLIFALNSYTSVNENHLEFGVGYTVNVYEWEDIKELYYNKNLDTHWYEIVTNDGKRYEIVFGGLFGADIQNYIRRTLEEKGIKMQDIS